MSRYLAILASSLVGYVIKTQSRRPSRMAEKLKNTIGNTIFRRASTRRGTGVTVMTVIASGAAAGLLVWGARRLMQERRSRRQRPKLTDEARTESPYLKRTEDLPLDLDL